MAIQLLFYGFLEQDEIEEKTIAEKLTDATLRRNNSTIDPLLLSCTCEVATTSLFALTKNFLYYTHSNTVRKHKLRNSSKKNSNKISSYTDGEVLNAGEHAVESLHGGRDSVTATFQNDSNESVTVILHDDGAVSTLQLDKELVATEFVCGKTFGLLRAADELLRIEQTKLSGDVEFSRECVQLPDDLGGVTEVSCGHEHALILTNRNKILSYGGGGRGQLGIGSIGSASEPEHVEALEPLNFKQVSAGGWHSLALSEEGDVYGWGWNQSGQVGGMPCLPESDCNGEAHSASSPVIQASEENISKLVFLPEVVDTPLSERFVCVSSGSRHSAAVTEDGGLYTWGWNGYGQLGHGDQDSRYSPTKVAGLAEYFVTGVRCSEWGTLVICRLKSK